MSPINRRSVGTFTVLGALLLGAAAPELLGQSAYQYDPERGYCVDREGHAGFNAVDPEALFALDPSEPEVFADRDASCIDFSGFDFNAYVGLGYPLLSRWHLEGARLQGAQLYFVRLSDADLRGTDMMGLNFGYTYISGTIDAYSKVPQVCRSQEGGRILCIR